MIVYNVKRRFFDMKADAEAYRRAEGLPPAATFKLEIDDRRQLAALLTELAEPLPSGVRPEAAAVGVTAPIVNDAFFVPERDILAFLLKDYRSRGYRV